MIKSLVIWVLIIPIAILNGAARDKILIPLIGDLALPASGISLSCCILIITYLLYPRLKIPARLSWRVGTLWLFLTIGFEFGFGHFVAGKPWTALLAQYSVQGGNLWLVVLLFVFLSPWLTVRIRGLLAIG